MKIINFFYVNIIFVLILESSYGFFEPITLGSLGYLAAGAALYFGYTNVFNPTSLPSNERFSRNTEVQNNIESERCDSNYIRPNIHQLKEVLNKYLFGQHIAIEEIIPALDGHYNSHPRKPLVFSLHGTPGTGKNYVSDFIVKYIYRKGYDSKYVHKFVGRSDFPLVEETHKYISVLNHFLREAVRNCKRSIFIFDEVDKMPPGVFDGITSFLDHHDNLNGISFRYSVFIFLSNTGSVDISKRLSELMVNGKLRSETRLKDFERLVEMGAYNLKGGLQKSAMIESHLIDHFIPFLPMEKEHVKKCIEQEYKNYGWPNPPDERINGIIDNYVTFESSGLFATSGCKRLNKKVESDVFRYQKQNE